jgi:proline iminopeptidase
MAAESSDGYREVLGNSIYYRTFGEAERGTVLCLHGGPGVPHNYLMPLTDLARFGYRVVLYDQSGCGRSEIPRNKAEFIMERYVEEVEALRSILRLGKVNIVGSSCGGQLGLAYALKYQRHLKSLISVGALANVPFVAAEMERMRSQLPREVVEAMKRYEASGDYDNPEYLKAVDVFYRKHVCRLEKWPEEVVYAFEHVSRPMYHTMNGPNEFTIIGNIRYWNIMDKLHTIRVPTLVTCGKHDEVSPKEARNIHRAIKGSKLVVFPRSSHLAFWEERGRFIDTLHKFLDRVN